MREILMGLSLGIITGALAISAAQLSNLSFQVRDVGHRIYDIQEILEKAHKINPRES